MLWKSHYATVRPSLCDFVPCDRRRKRIKCQQELGTNYKICTRLDRVSRSKVGKPQPKAGEKNGARKRNDKSETKPPKQAKRPKQNDRNNRNDRNKTIETPETTEIVSKRMNKLKNRPRSLSRYYGSLISHSDHHKFAPGL